MPTATARSSTPTSTNTPRDTVLVAIGPPRADPLIGLAITLIILKITWDSWRVVSTTEPGVIAHRHQH